MRIVGTLVVIFALLGLDHIRADETWVGKTAVVKRPGVVCARIDTKKMEIISLAQVNGVAYVVTAERDDCICFREADEDWWFPKSEAVLIEKAVEYFTSVIKEDANDFVGRYGRASVLARQGQYQQALRDCDEMLRLHPEAGVAWRLRGCLYEQLGEVDKAIHDFSEAIRLEPDDSFSRSRRGWLFGRLVQYGKAESDLSEAIRLNPNDASLYLWRAWCCYAQGEHAKSRADLKEAGRLAPKDAYIAQYSNKLQESIATAEAADRWRDIAPNGHVAATGTAEDRLEKALGLDSKRASTYLSQGKAHNENREYLQAIADLTEAIRLDGALPDAYSARAVAYRALGRQEQAMADERKAKELNK
jgi:tetratricopeptide (TPR) repeat protein